MLTYADVCWRMLTYAGFAYIIYRFSHSSRAGAFIGYADVCWCMLTYADVCWRMLMYAGACWHMLAYADVCWRMLTYTDVCWRMLTFADVCWRMLHTSSTASLTAQEQAHLLNAVNFRSYRVHLGLHGKCRFALSHSLSLSLSLSLSHTRSSIKELY